MVKNTPWTPEDGAGETPKMARAAIGQITSTASMAHNLAQCKTVIQKAVAGGAKALFLPEASDYIGSSPAESKSLAQPVTTSPFVQGLIQEAQHHHLPISVGIHEPSSDPTSSRIKNTLIYITATGQITQRYQKLHLFDLDIPDGPTMRESDIIEPGREILPPFPTPVGKVGSQICFDLRFPEPALALKRQGAEILLYPSAFMPETGAAHWMALLRARAIESESYVFAAAQVGWHNAKRRSYGHGVVIDPWGKVVVELGGEGTGEVEVGFVDVDLEKVERTRKMVPLLRRTDVYPEI